MNHSLQTARTLIEQHELTLERLWVRYWGEGGSASLHDLGLYVYEVEATPSWDLLFLKWALHDVTGDTHE